MIDFIRSFYKAKVSQFRLKAQESDALSRFISEASDLVTERPTDGGFIKTDQISDREKGHLESNQLDMIRQARKYFRWDAHGRACLQSMVNYVMGQGISITPKSQDPMVWYVWKEFWTACRNKMELKQFEIPTRFFRDGEVLIEFFKEDDEGQSTGKTTIRFIDPLLLKNPATVIGQGPSNFSYDTTRGGIETDPEDIEKVICYWVQSRTNVNEFRKVPAENVLHIKCFADSDQKRGETYIQPIMRMITQYQQWLDNRIILNKMRSAIVLIRKVEGTTAQVNEVLNAIQNSSNVRSGETKKQNIRGGSILNAGGGVSYEMLAPNINASDVKDDGRAIKLNIAAGTNLPEYILGDASNANYASTLIAESPFVKSIQFWQKYLEYFIVEIYKRVIQNAVEANIITAPSDEEFLRKLKGVGRLQEQNREELMAEIMPNGKMETPSEVFYGADVQWPEIIHRDIKAHVEALQFARSAGWIADPTASASLGYDFAEEVRKQKAVEDEAKKAGNPLLGIKGQTEQKEEDEGDMENELQNLLTSLSPEEKQQILTRNNPIEIAQMLLSKVGGNGGNQNANRQVGSSAE